MIETIGEVASAFVTLLADAYNDLTLGAAAEPFCLPDPDGTGLICMELQLGMMPIAPGSFAARIGSGERRIAAAWGAGTYRHGGLMTSIEHIMYRHGFNSGFSNVSRFARGTRARQLLSYVDDALRNGVVTDLGGGVFRVEYNLGRVIGTDAAGNAASSIRVLVENGIIRTAYPI